MIDIHTHVVFGVDDGAKTIEESVTMLLEAEKAGYTDIIATPHYMEGYYEVPKKEISKKIELLNNVLSSNNIKLKIHQGNEIYFTDKITALIKDEQATSLNDSKYVLFETPMNAMPLNLLQIIYQLLEKDKIPIIAHPERYTFIQENPNEVYRLIQDGVLFQSNIGSIVGVYGKEAQKTVVQLLKNNMVHFFGSDTHRSNSIYKEVEHAIAEMKKIISEEQIRKLTYDNAQKVLNNEKFEIDEPVEIRNNWFKKLF